VSCWPSHSFLDEFDEERCCGKVARFTLPTETLYNVELRVWACAEHYDEWMEDEGL